MNKVYFIGAGPGDPEMITIKGKRLIDESDVIIYAGSLVNEKILRDRKQESLVYNSAYMTLEEVISVIKENFTKGKKVVRIHSGDPSIYGAIREQIDALEKLGIDSEVVPGVSSFVASAAAIEKEFTLPGVSQTIICTRLGGRTEVPEKESLESLASHNASMAIFLSVQMIDQVAERLKSHYKETTPVAVIQRVSWEDEKIIIGNLSNIAEKVKKEGITKTAQILVGDFLGDEYELSKLYDSNFSHGYRRAK
ncbi:precorrin-4 C(11)-methyltransferase [Sporanaerobacter sp. PP17-6a]|jgi:precorrin-4/cobalt-precorrin-4 C11-methyltransferase|uniref:precorrin-4 C(11)-methyltransferase n=1 Tax=Sporanaerobacter sp. PP17-6a TaxID=1891289 RepID=UPI00089F9066|nr:precorrin-4 C(11)-methyltransferase [Sporanaerobacter sp. PP17-6a]SCL88598.1 Cobalt-precorrin-4 C(11)-methyltransferase [Sporanaerobacter sp. PP17-6a]